jgi:AcrR family transcriptional regulator
MSAAASPSPFAADNPIRERILAAAFEAFTEVGYAGTSTLDIARRAKVSKRDLYAHFGSKQAVLVACIKIRAARMARPAEPPTPRDREMLASILIAFAETLLREISHPHVIAMFRLAIAEAVRSPEIAQALDDFGREATRRKLVDLLTGAQSSGLLGPGEPTEMASQYFGLVWEGLMVGLLLGVAPSPDSAEIERRAAKAASAFMQLHSR